MKLLQFFAVMLAVLVLGVSVVRAREDVVEVAPQSVSESKGDVVDQSMDVSYELPSPGILPGHVFYPIKMLRDRVLEWLTFDPSDKAELLVLYADKRMAMAKRLFEDGSEELGVETGLKAVMYQDRAVSILESQKKQGEDVGVLANRLERGTAKHSSLWMGMVDDVSETVMPRMNEYKDRTLELNKRMNRVLERE